MNAQKLEERSGYGDAYAAYNRRFWILFLVLLFHLHYCITVCCVMLCVFKSLKDRIVFLLC